jgi:hypothetical protein
MLLMIAIPLSLDDTELSERHDADGVTTTDRPHLSCMPGS